MTHWFDRLSATLAEPGSAGVSRRGALKRAGIAAALASPLASPAVARAGIELEGRAHSAGCDACLYSTIVAHNKVMQRCDKTGSMWGSVPRGKKKGKAAPVSAAKRLACAMQERAELGHDLNFCRQNPCAGQPTVPVVPDPNSPFGATPGTSGCPPGTGTCPDGSCCYGGDLCCVCASTGGYICCVAVIGCTCCAG